MTRILIYMILKIKKKKKDRKWHRRQINCHQRRMRSFPLTLILPMFLKKAPASLKLECHSSLTIIITTISFISLVQVSIFFNTFTSIFHFLLRFNHNFFYIFITIDNTHAIIFNVFIFVQL